jgi:hypothetical protein
MVLELDAVLCCVGLCGAASDVTCARVIVRRLLGILRE